jgi:hypothetical protein
MIFVSTRLPTLLEKHMVAAAEQANISGINKRIWFALLYREGNKWNQRTNSEMGRERKRRLLAAFSTRRG